MVAKGVERYAKEHGIAVITPDTMRAVREQAEQKYGGKFKSHPNTSTDEGGE